MSEGEDETEIPEPANEDEDPEAVRLRSTTLIARADESGFVDDITEDLAVDAAEALREIMPDPAESAPTPEPAEGIKLADIGAAPQSTRVITQKIRAFRPESEAHLEDDDTIELVSDPEVPVFEEEKTQH